MSDEGAVRVQVLWHTSHIKFRLVELFGTV